MAMYCRLKDIIEERGMTQLHVSHETRLSPTIIGALCRQPYVKRIDVGTAETLLDFLGLSTLDDLYERRKNA